MKGDYNDMFISTKNIVTNGKSTVEFSFNIRSLIEKGNTAFVLLDIPFNDSAINNIYCLNSDMDIVWKVQDLNQVNPGRKNLPYEQMTIKDNTLYATDFLGRCYRINCNDGKIEGKTIVK